MLTINEEVVPYIKVWREGALPISATICILHFYKNLVINGQKNEKDLVTMYGLLNPYLRCLTKIDDQSIRSNNEHGLSMCYAQLVYAFWTHYYIIIYFVCIDMVCLPIIHLLDHVTYKFACHYPWYHIIHMLIGNVFKVCRYLFITLLRLAWSYDNGLNDDWPQCNLGTMYRVSVSSTWWTF